MRGGKPGHNDRLGQKTVGGKANSQVIDTEQDNRKNEIDGRTSKRNESTLPALLREKLVGRTRGFLAAGVDIGDVLSGHADVTAEREGADAPIRSASFNAKKPRTEADGKDINANAKEARDDKMSPFVNQDYDPEDKDDANKSVHASNKLRRTILTKSLATNYHCLRAVFLWVDPATAIQPLLSRKAGQPPPKPAGELRHPQRERRQWTKSRRAACEREPVRSLPGFRGTASGDPGRRPQPLRRRRSKRTATPRLFSGPHGQAANMENAAWTPSRSPSGEVSSSPVPSHWMPGDLDRLARIEWACAYPWGRAGQQSNHR